MTNNNNNTIGYIRVSWEKQSENGFGLRVQSDLIKKHCKSNWLELIKVFSEEWVSGALAKRPALWEMLRYIEKQWDINKVVFLRLDRLARDLIIQESLIDEFQKLWVKPVSIEEPDLCSKEPSRILFRQMKWAIAQYEKAMITLRLSAGRRKKAESWNGYSWWNIAFGFKQAENGKFEAVTDELNIVREIFRLRRKPRGANKKKMSFQKIADYLNDKYSDIRRFNPMSVHYIINNNFYRGFYEYGGVKTFYQEIKIL